MGRDFKKRDDYHREITSLQRIRGIVLADTVQSHLWRTDVAQGLASLIEKLMAADARRPPSDPPADGAKTRRG